MNHPQPDKAYLAKIYRGYILSAGRKFTGRQYGTARALIHYRDLLETYVEAKRKASTGAA